MPKKKSKKRQSLRKRIKPRRPKIKVKKPKAKIKVKARKKIEPMARLLLPLGRIKEIFRTRYGFFLYDGSEFVINNPETPSPWFNILTNGDYGMMVSQTGSGMSFKGGVGNRITKWYPNFKSSNIGKFVYIRDNQTQQAWSATWKPMGKKPDFYEVRHGIGYTNISSSTNGIISSLIYYVAADEPVEIWQMRIRNVTDQERFLSLFSYLEWDFECLSDKKEYDKLFVETSYDEGLSAIFAKDFKGEYAFHSVNNRVSTFTCGSEFFLGSYRDASNPRCVEKGMCFGENGRFDDPAAALHLEIELPPNGEKELIFTVGKCSDRKEAERLIRKYKNVKVVEEEFSRTCHRWTIRFNSFQITTPDEGTNILNNKWLRYQAMSAGLSSFGAYYNTEGLVSLKDYLINGLTLLSINPKYHRQLLLNCAEKQFEDGSVIDNWDPITQRGRRSQSIEVPLWLVYSVCEYLKETADTSVLDEEIKFQDMTKKNLFAHCTNAITKAFDSFGKRGLPSAAGGDYIKGLDGIFKDGKGDSIWLGQFFFYVVSEFLVVCALKKDKQLVSDYEGRLKKLKDRVKKLGWDNDRFIRAISHTGANIGLSKGKNARLFLDTQTWSILSGICDGDESFVVMDNVKTRLYKEHGPIVVSPCFTQYQEDIGLISKLPAGVMENGGVSIEQACWCIWSETKLGRGNNAWNIYTKINPIDRSHKSDLYKLEPFVSCEYINGPDTAISGGALNSWYNRCGYWMFKVMTEEILGIKATFDGLLISPCIPDRWRLFKVRRSFRNAYYTIEVVNPHYVSKGIAEVIIDGKKTRSNLIPAFGDEKRHHVKVIMGKVKS